MMEMQKRLTNDFRGSLIFVIASFVLLSGCTRKTSAGFEDQERATFAGMAKSIPTEDGVRVGQLYMSVLRKEQLTPNDVDFLLSVVDRTKGKSDEGAFKIFTTLTLGKQQTYPLVDHDRIFDLAETAFSSDTSKSVSARQFGALNIFSNLQDKRAVPILQQFGKSGNEKFNTRLASVLLQLSS